MPDQIRPLTQDLLQDQARAAAEQGIPLEEASLHISHEPSLLRKFTAAYEASIGEVS